MKQPDSDRRTDTDEEERALIVIQSMDDIPRFKSDDEEHVFWDTHTLALHLFIRRGHRPGSLVATIAEQRKAQEAGKSAE